MSHKIKKMYPDATIPTRGSNYAAGFDLYAYLPDGDVTIPAHGTKMVGTGIAAAPMPGYFGAIYPRSGIASKRSLRPANCVGVCDEDYRGEYKVALHNDSNEPQTVSHGERIAQLVFCPYSAEVEIVDDLDETERGAGGFGSTGKF